MDAYIATMDKVGDAIIAFIDPEKAFTGYTKVRKDFQNPQLISKDPFPFHTTKGC